MIGFGQLTMIPDANFEQALIDLGCDTGTTNGSVPTTNINTVTYLDVSIQSIYDLTGIEDFTALTYLDCSWNQLTSLDVSQNTALGTFYCQNNQLISLDVSQNTALGGFLCANNLLTNLDVSGSPALTHLACYNNQLTSLNISGATALTDLNCNGNQLTSLDLSNNTALTYFESRNNQLTNLNVSNNTALWYLRCSSNPIISLDISNNTALSWLNCSSNQLDSLDVSNNTALTKLYCEWNNLTSLDVSNNTALTYLCCGDNQLTSLDLRNGNNTSITSFFSYNNPNLTCVDVDNVAWSTLNWIVGNLNIDIASSFSTNCATAFGCADSLACNYDSLATIDDSSCVYPVMWQQAFSICDGDSVVVGISVYDAAGNYIDTLTAGNGCDSIVYSNVSISSIIWNQTYLICDGDSIVVGTSVYDTTGTYTDTLNASNGCDSIVYTYILMSPPIIWQQAFSICDGDSVVVGISVYDAAGNYIDTLTAGNGCDSIVYTNISVTQPSVWNQTYLICDGDSIVVGTSVYNAAGTYIDTLTAGNGCDSIVYTYILMSPPIIWQQAFSICAGDSVVVGVSVYDTPGNYIDILNAGNGCDSIVYTNVSVTPPPVWNQTYLICDGDSIVVGSSVYNAAGTYTDTLSSSNGCDSIVYTYIVVDQNTSSSDTLAVTASIVWNGMTLTVSGDYSVTLINSVGCDSITNLNLTITIPSGILGITNTERALVKITDMLGQETPYRRNTPLFYIYNDGTVEKRIVIE